MLPAKVTLNLGHGAGVLLYDTTYVSKQGVRRRGYL